MMPCQSIPHSRLVQVLSHNYAMNAPYNAAVQDHKNSSKGPTGIDAADQANKNGQFVG